MIAMMEMQSKNVAKLIPALVLARQGMEGAVKKAKGNWGAYASLEDLIECCIQPLLDNNIMLTQATTPVDGVSHVMSQVTHSSGEFMRAYTPIVVVKDNDPQKALAGLTYARRGSLEALLAIPRVDDDGEHGNGKPKKKTGSEWKPTPAPTDKAMPTNVDESTGEIVDDIPYPEEQEELLTVAERKELNRHREKHGVPEAAAKQLLIKLGYETSADIPKIRYGFVKSELQRLGQILNQGAK